MGWRHAKGRNAGARCTFPKVLFTQTYLYYFVHNEDYFIPKGDNLVSTKAMPHYEHSPTLNTVTMVEETLRTMDESVITIAELKRILPRKVNHNVLKTILRYLEESNKILVTVDGITWIFNPHPELRKAISKGLEL